MSSPVHPSAPESGADGPNHAAEGPGGALVGRRAVVAAALAIGGATAAGVAYFSPDSPGAAGRKVAATKGAGTALADAPVSGTSSSGSAVTPSTAPPVGDLLGTAAQPAAVGLKPRGAVATKPMAGGGYGDADQSRNAGGAAPPLVPPGRQYSGFAAAAAAATPVVSILSAASPWQLLRRTTFGARPGDVAAVTQAGIDSWLSTQLDPALPDPEGDQAWATFPLAGATPAAVLAANDGDYTDDPMRQTARATLARQLFSRRQLYEIVVDVFANHLNVPLPLEDLWLVGPSYHVEVIRAHAYGTFREMLLAAGRHPGMLRFLNNDQSTKANVNENLGRELLELHTVGINGGYTEGDVRNSAYVLSGRTIDDKGQFRYDAGRHYTGPVTVLGWSNANATGDGGLAMGDDYLTYLADHPSTARAVCRKLAIRFVGDAPSDDLLGRLTAAYTANQTAILPVLQTLFSSSDFWSAVGTKTRRPAEDLVATSRALGVTPGPDSAGAINGMYGALADMGNAPIGWIPPNGYPDVAAAWNSAGDLLDRWNNHRAAVGGWWKGLTWPAPAAVVGAVPATYGEYVDRLCTTLTGQVFGAAHRDALLGFLGVAGTDAVPGADLGGMAPHLLPLVFDSPYFQLR